MAKAPQGMWNCYSKSQRLRQKLHLPTIEAKLKTHCGRGSQRHTCLDPFRNASNDVLTWRSLWYALPKVDRFQRLVNMFTTQRALQLKEHGGDQSAFCMRYFVMGHPVCRTAFIVVTDIFPDTISAARAATKPNALPDVSAHALTCGRGRKAVLGSTVRSWLLDFAKVHADSSPIGDKLYLPSGRKDFYWTVYVKDRTQAGDAEIASSSTFLMVWRKELPWIVVRTPGGPFTHCGLCEFLKMLASNTTDAGLRNALLERLGQHYHFQASQRIAALAISRLSERNPADTVFIEIDKMDQQKTIVPRVHALSQTALMKTAPRIVTGLIGVLVPGVWERPLVYTVFENINHGANMQCGVLLHVLLGIKRKLGCMPRRVVIKADNTVKETKNTVTLFWAAWLLAQLWTSRLESIEFAYLVVGHTHDLIDTMFSFVARALHGQDYLSVPQMFDILQERMNKPPLWHHLQDVFQWRDNQPQHLSALEIKGITVPHHVCISKSNSGITLRAKRWLTDAEWEPPIPLCTAEERCNLTRVWPHRVQLAWPTGFAQGATAFLRKLQQLLETRGASTTGLEHCEKLVNDADPVYLPTTISLANQIRQFSLPELPVQRAGEGGSAVPPVAPAGTMDQIVAVAASTFRGSAAHLVPTAGPCLLKRRAGEPDAVDVGRFCAQPLKQGDFALYHPRAGGRGLPLRLGKTLRVVDASESPGKPYVIMESWWPLHKHETYGESLNLYGTWIPSAAPLLLATAIGTKQRSALVRQNVVQEQIIVEEPDVLVWPVVLEVSEALDAKLRGNQSGKIPFAALRHAHECSPGLDLTSAKVCFTTRGGEFRRTLGGKRPRCH